MTGHHVVCPLNDLPPGTMKLVPVGKFGVGVYNVDGNLYALANFCAHRGGPVCLGKTIGWAEPGDNHWEVRVVREGEFLRCPWHQWEYEIETGSAVVYKDTKRPYSLRTYPVRVEDGNIVLEGV